MDQDTSTTANPAENARTSTRTSARNPIVELITRGEPRRRWSIEQKQAIAAESLAPGASPTVVARRYGISSGLLYNWRKSLLAAQPGFVAGFARVEITEHDRLAAPIPSVPPLLPTPTPQPVEQIEITLPDGTMLRIPARIDPRALRDLVNALRR
jgi:transposase